LNSNYIINGINDKQIWNNYLTEFNDANLYQTWDFAATAQDEKFVEHIAIFKNNLLISIAQVRIRVIPGIKLGIAYIFRGPLWQKKNQETELETLIAIFNILREEYAIKRKLLLRIRPFVFLNKFNSDRFNILSDFIRKEKNEKNLRTIILDLNGTLDEIRQNFRRSWKENLRKAEKNGLEIISNHNLKTYDSFINIYNNMIQRKKFKEYVNPLKIIEVNKKLEVEFKAKIFIAYKDGVPSSALMGSAIGETGMAILGGVNELGMKCRSAYLLQWEMIKWLKSMNCRQYDLGGIDPIANPGGYIWKTGMSKNEVEELGIYEYSENKFSQILVKTAQLMQNISNRSYSYTKSLISPAN
jgi:lipid II:glycine glycyltransferase (peptidoglycan interpeptide bridge formation enzyme)